MSRYGAISFSDALLIYLSDNAWAKALDSCYQIAFDTTSCAPVTLPGALTTRSLLPKTSSHVNVHLQIEHVRMRTERTFMLYHKYARFIVEVASGISFASASTFIQLDSCFV